MIRRIYNALRGARAGYSWEGNLGDFIVQAWQSGYFTPVGVAKYFAGKGATADPFRVSPSVSSAAKFLADFIGGIPLVVYEASSESEDGKRPVADTDRWQRLFTRPSPELERSDLMAMWALNIINDGRALWLCQDKNGNPVDAKDAEQFWPLSPKTAERIVDKRSGLTRAWKARLYPKADPVVYEAETVLEWRDVDPDDPHGCFSRVSPVRQGAAMQSAAKEANQSILEQSLGFSGIFSSPDWLIPNRRKEAAQAIEEDSKGSSKAGRALFLPGNVKWEKNTMDMQKMQYAELLQFLSGEDRICIGVPAGLLSPDANVPFASLFAMLQYFAQFRVRPMLDKFEGVMWSRVFSRVEAQRYWVEFDTTGFAVFNEDEKLKAEVAKALKELNVSTADAAQMVRLRLPKRPYHDQVLVNSAMVPIEAAAAGETLATPANAPVPPPESGTPAAATTPEQAKVQPSDETKAAKGSDERAATEEDLTRWDEYVRAVLDPNERRARGILKRYFNSLRLETLKRLEEVAPARRSTMHTKRVALSEIEIAKVLFDVDEWSSRLKDVLTPAWRSAATDGVQDLADQVGALSEWGKVSEATLAKIVESGALRVRGVNDETRAKLYQVLVEQASKNATVAEYQQAINRLLNARGSGWALVVARSETAMASSTARDAAAVAEGFTTKTWITAGDEAVSDGSHGNRDHASLDGQTVAISATFSNGLTHTNEVGADAREVVNCRCVTQYQ